MDTPVNRLRNHLREHALHYYPELGAEPVHVQWLGSRDGDLSSVHRFCLRSGGVERRVVVKLAPSRARGDGRRAGRPRVAPLLDPCTKNASEHAALRAMQEHFDALGDFRFGSVRILDFVSALRGIVMEETRGRSLTRLLVGANRLRRPLGSRRLEEVFGHTGAWLRAYHELPPLGHTRSRSTTREEFVACVRRLAGFLAESHRFGPLQASAVSRTESWASKWLPATLPLGTSHGDLAPRNVIVDCAGRVTVLDTRAAWRAPIYEDIGYFLTAAKTPRAQAASLGLALGRTLIGRLERAFLRGYFAGEPVPIECIRLFELQSLLDKWASNTASRERSVGLGGLAGAYRHWSSDRLFQRSIGALLDQLAPQRAVA